MTDAPELRRGLFGYRKDGVQALVADRERIIREVSGDARSAQAQLETTQRELDQVRTDLVQLREQLEARTTELASARGRLAEVETHLAAATSQVDEQTQHARDTAQRLQARETSLLERISSLENELDEARAAPPAGVAELTAVLDATRDAVERIMAGARRSAEDQLADVQRTREQLQVEIDRASAWREHVSPLVDGVRREIGRTQAHVLQVGARVAEALRPMTDALTTLGQTLDDLERGAAAQTAADPATDRVDLASHERNGEEEREGLDQPASVVQQAAREMRP